ncbi:helicase POLQ-like [Macrobrachium nipponense]|uniref:helicase POLQ-like n=1 Tax=Macrobrachium nipponense TaxID=159736 RepID=UPI0030C7ED6B
MDLCRSTLDRQDDFGLISLLFSSLGLGIATSLANLKKLVSMSLLAAHPGGNQVELENKVTQILENLRIKGLVRIKNFTCENEVTVAKITGDSSEEESTKENLAKQAAQVINRPISDGDELAASRLGHAAIKGNIDLDLASCLYSDLITARENLAVNCYLHLLYLVVPYDIVSSVKVVPDVLYKAFLMLGDEELKVARLLGITEGVLIKLTMGQRSKKTSENVLQRFYVALILYQLWLGTGIWES